MSSEKQTCDLDKINGLFIQKFMTAIDTIQAKEKFFIDFLRHFPVIRKEDSAQVLERIARLEKDWVEWDNEWEWVMELPPHYIASYAGYYIWATSGLTVRSYLDGMMATRNAVKQDLNQAKAYYKKFEEN